MSATRTTPDKSADASGAPRSDGQNSAAALAEGGSDKAQSLLNAAAAPTVLLLSLAVELQRLQAEAFAATSKALETAMQAAAQSSQPQDLLQVQFDFVAGAMERAANYNREWFSRVADAQSQLVGLAPNAAMGAAMPSLPSLSPGEFLSRGPEAWTQLTRQWMNGATGGASGR